MTWLLVFRAVVITVLLVTSLLSRFTSSDELAFAEASLGLYVIATTAYLSVLAGGLWLRAFGDRGIIALAYGQLIVDALIASGLVAVTGGVESVFVFVYSLTILNAAAVLERRGAFMLATIASAQYAIVLVLEVVGTIDSASGARLRLVDLIAPFITNTASFYLVAALVGYLTSQLRTASERLQDATTELRRLERLYEAVLRSLPSGVLTVNDDGVVLFINAAGAEILREQDLVGRSLSSAIPALAEVLGPSSDQRFEIQLVREHTISIGGSAAPLVGSAQGFVIVFQDLTELRRLQADVVRSERLAELGRFAAGMAHEIRNPLAAMIGCLQLLRLDEKAGKPIGEESGRMLGIVHREAERLSNLVTEFLTYARPSPPRVESIDLGEIVRETAAAAGGLEGVLVEARPVQVGARCDAGQIRQVLWNLVMNAREALVDRGRTDGHIVIAVRREGGVALMSVDDNGPGVAEEIRGRVFEPFFTTRAQGTGLGLATSYQVLAQQAGNIQLQASPLGGARFVITLPLAALDAGRPVD